MNSVGAGCQTFTTNFTLYNPNQQPGSDDGDDGNEQPKDGNSLSLGLGIGLGVGIPILILAAFGVWWMRRRKQRQLATSQGSELLSQKPVDASQKHADITPVPTYRDGNADRGSSDGSKYGQRRSMAELGETTYELSSSQQIHEAEPLDAKTEPRELP